MSHQRMREEERRLEEEIQQLLEKARQTDAAEDQHYGPDKSGGEWPPELQRREQRLEKIREAKPALEEEQAAADRAKGRSPDDDRVAGGERPQGGRSKFKREFGEPEPTAQRGKRQYARRKGMVEPTFGWLKEVSGFRQFSLRGLKKAQGEWSLVTLALNRRRMARMEAVPTAA